MHARFREGVHAWIAAMPAPPVEYLLLDAAPELPDDAASWAACWALFAWGLSGNWDLELLRAHLAAELGEEAAGRLLPPLSGHPTAPAAGRLAGDLLRELPRPPRGQGSNAWAVAGARTASGKPLLANDPHLLVQQPGAWLELHLRAPGYEARGVAVPFAPGIVLGATAHHAWGATNVSGDVQDLYLERLNDDGTAARYEDAWEPLTVAPRGDPRPRERRAGRARGPRDPARPAPRFLSHRAVSARRSDPSTHLRAPVGRRRAQHPPVGAGRRRERRELRGVPRGRSRARVPGPELRLRRRRRHDRLPVHRAPSRPPAGDGTVPVPGWTAEHEWDGFVPFEELPSAVDPGRGYLVTANDGSTPTTTRT